MSCRINQFPTEWVPWSESEEETFGEFALEPPFADLEGDGVLSEVGRLA